jgi:hypothetical protein
VIFEQLNNVFNLHRFHTGLGLRGIWMLFPLDMPAGEVVEVSSSYDLFLFSLKAVVMCLRDHRVL